MTGRHDDPVARTASGETADETADEVVLFDFGDTLADQTWMLTDLGVYDGWGDAFRRASTSLASDWGLGRVTTEGVADAVARLLDTDPAGVRDHMRRLNGEIRFFSKVVGAARRRRERGGRQALVTVNPADFGEIVSLHGLDGLFDTVVISGQEGDDDKTALCRIALARLDVAIADAVLIDNLSANVESFIASGGRGYVFVGEDRFVADVRKHRVPAFVPGDVA